MSEPKTVDLEVELEVFRIHMMHGLKTGAMAMHSTGPRLT